MNENYLQKEWMKADATRQVLGRIIAELNKSAGFEAWKLEPAKRDDYPPHWHAIHGQHFDLIAEINQQGRLEVALGRWPTYPQPHGGTAMVTPRDLHPRPETDARTTADIKREPRLIARQIIGKVIEPGTEIMARLREIAASRAAWTERVTRQQDALAAAVGSEIRNRSEQVTIYANNIPGETVRIQYRGPTSVSFEVDADEAIVLLDVLRELRTKAEAA